MKNRNVVLMLMLMCAVFSSPLFAQTTTADSVEAYVISVSTTYVDFVYEGGDDEGNGVPDYTRNGITCTTNVSNWGYPDGSDDEFFVDGNGSGEGDCFDSKSGSGNSDFTATITGLAAGATYDVYLHAMHSDTSYGYKWGFASASENLIDPTDGPSGINTFGNTPGSKGTHLWQLGTESIQSSGSGVIVLHFGQHGGRTQYDGVLLALQDPTVNPAPVVDAGPDQFVYDPEGVPVTLAGSATDLGPTDGTSPGSPGGVVSSYWYMHSGPVGGVATFDPVDTNLVYDPNVTFNILGVYELVLQASDGLVDGNDIVAITVRDHSNDLLVGHWPLDGDALDYGDNVEQSDGTLEGAEYRSEPNAMPQYDTDAAVGTHSIDLRDSIGLEVIDDHDPNVPHIDLGLATELDFGTGSWAVSAWVKTTTMRPEGDDSEKGAIFANGADNGGGHRYTLVHNENDEGRVTIVTDDDSTKYDDARTDDNINNDFWHLIVAVRDSDFGELRIYSDGILDDSEGTADGYSLSGTSGLNSYIGMIADAANGGIYKHFDGKVDDVRVYNYILPLDDPTYPSILSLAAMGQLAATVDAGPDQSLELQRPITVVTEGTSSDNGLPGALTYKWSTVSRPAIADSNAVFTDDTALITDVEFPEFGVWTLQVTVFDVDLGTITDSSTVTLTLVSPDCSDVIAAGLLLPGDIAGGGVAGDEPDCRIDLNDIAAIAAIYLVCNDPLDASCEWPF